MQFGDAQEFLSISHAAERAQVSVDTLRRWANEGKVRTFRTPGGQRRFLAADIDAIYEVEARGGAA